MRRKEELVTGEIYHAMSKSIAGFKVFNNSDEFIRIKQSMRYYQVEDVSFKFSKFIKLENVQREGFYKCFISMSQGKEKLVQIIAYCVMPTHLHFILRQLKDNGISIFMGNLNNSYSRYFNTKIDRKGPLWESKFKNVLVSTDEQLLHLTRYIHLNPVTAYLVSKPEDWHSTSYHEYTRRALKENKLCEFNDMLNINSDDYEIFVKDMISYQRELAMIKKLLIEN